MRVGIKQLNYFKNKIKAELELMRNDIGELRYSIYTQMVEGCEDYYELLELAELEMQIEFIKYTKDNITSKLKESDTTVRDLKEAMENELPAYLNEPIETDEAYEAVEDFNEMSEEEQDEFLEAMARNITDRMANEPEEEKNRDYDCMPGMEVNERLQEQYEDEEIARFISGEDNPEDLDDEEDDFIDEEDDDELEELLGDNDEDEFSNSDEDEEDDEYLIDDEELENILGEDDDDNESEEDGLGDEEDESSDEDDDMLDDDFFFDDEESEDTDEEDEDDEEDVDAELEDFFSDDEEDEEEEESEEIDENDFFFDDEDEDEEVIDEEETDESDFFIGDDDEELEELLGDDDSDDIEFGDEEEEDLSDLFGDEDEEEDLEENEEDSEEDLYDLFGDDEDEDIEDLFIDEDNGGNPNYRPKVKESVYEDTPIDFGGGKKQVFSDTGTQNAFNILRDVTDRAEKSLHKTTNNNQNKRNKNK